MNPPTKPRRKKFRKVMWAVLDERIPHHSTFYQYKETAQGVCGFHRGCRVARVSIQELPSRKGRRK